MISRVRQIWLPLVLLLVGLVVTTGCNDEDKIVVQNVTDTTNDPPLIVTQGPEVPNGGFEQIVEFEAQGIPIYVIGGDPDGLGDLSVAILTVDSIQLNRFIPRPDTSTSGCLAFSYADTIPTNQILPTPMTLPGIPFHSMLRYEGGLFQSQPLGSYIGFPNFVALSPTLDNWGGGCGSTNGMVAGPYTLIPPAVPSPKTVAITYVDQTFHGVKVTLYDKVGATAVANYPDIRLVLTTSQEQTALP